MLRTRILTALIVLPLFLGALFWFPNWAWDLFTLGVVLVACNEWTAFCGFPEHQARVYRIFTIVLCLLLAVAYVQTRIPGLMEQVGQVLFSLSAVLWIIVVPLWLWRGWKAPPPWVRGIVGWVVILPTWAAFLLLHDSSPWLLLTLMIIVFTADSGAYFAGRAFGKHKLAPTVSPNKTWEGVVGGLIAVMLFFFAWFFGLRYMPSAQWSAPLLAFGAWLPLIFLLLASFSVLGDLYESWMKRCVGVKDSGTLLPGHGGVMDRIDALTSALPMAGLLIYVLPRI